MSHAIEELVGNAIPDHDGPEKPGIAIYTEQADDSVTVFVADDGPGLSQDEIDVLQAEEETDLQHGSGVGLWLVRWVVERSNGELMLETTADGTVIGIRLRSPESEL